MVKQIIWSLKAQKDRKEIFTYWNNRNRSATYSKKLNQLFKDSIEIIAEFPRVGKPTELENIRIKIVRDYLIVYEYTKTKIYILAIWDSRQNPEKLKGILQ